MTKIPTVKYDKHDRTRLLHGLQWQTKRASWDMVRDRGARAPDDSRVRAVPSLPTGRGQEYEARGAVTVPALRAFVRENRKTHEATAKLLERFTKQINELGEHYFLVSQLYDALDERIKKITDLLKSHGISEKGR